MDIFEPKTENGERIMKAGTGFLPAGFNLEIDLTKVE